VLTVARTPDGISVRQDRLLEGGGTDGADGADSTLWCAPARRLSRVILTRFQAGPARDPLLKTALSHATGPRARPHRTRANLRAAPRRAVQAERERDRVLYAHLAPSRRHMLTAPAVRVLYEPALFAEVAAEAARPGSAFDARDAAGLISDALALGRAGRAPAVRVLELAHALRHSADCACPWRGVPCAADARRRQCAEWRRGRAEHARRGVGGAPARRDRPAPSAAGALRRPFDIPTAC
jgi:hypothetical protein